MWHGRCHHHKTVSTYWRSLPLSRLSVSTAVACKVVHAEKISHGPMQKKCIHINSAPCRKGSTTVRCGEKLAHVPLVSMHEKLYSSQVVMQKILYSYSAQRHGVTPRITMHRIRCSIRDDCLVPTCSSQSSPKFRIPKRVCNTPSCSGQRQHQIQFRIPEEVRGGTSTCAEDHSAQNAVQCSTRDCCLTPTCSSQSSTKCRVPKGEVCVMLPQTVAPTCSSQSSTKCRVPKGVCVILPHAVAKDSTRFRIQNSRGSP